MTRMHDSQRPNLCRESSIEEVTALSRFASWLGVVRWPYQGLHLLLLAFWLCSQSVKFVIVYYCLSLIALAYFC